MVNKFIVFMIFGRSNPNNNFWLIMIFGLLISSHSPLYDSKTKCVEASLFKFTTIVVEYGNLIFSIGRTMSIDLNETEGSYINCKKS